MDLSEIKRLRTKIGMSQTALAKKAGVSQAHIAKIETGKVDPRYSTVERVMRCLKEEEKDHCAKYMTTRIFGVQADEPASAAARLMREREVSQVVVFRREAAIGLITEEDILRSHGGSIETPAEKMMGDPPPTVSKSTSSDTVRELLLEFQAVIVMDKERAVGILTKSDLIKRT